MKYKSNISYYIMKYTLSPIFKLLYRPRIINKNYIPEKGPIILCGNHQHNFDPFLVVLSTKRQIHFLAKKELFTGFKKNLFKLVGCIPVNRQIKDEKAKAKALKYLRKNNAIGLFPEGTRNKTKDLLLLPFKFGAVSFAKKTNALIVPFAIIGKFKFFNNKLKIVFDKPLNIKDLDLESANILLYEKIKNLLQKNRN